MHHPIAKRRGGDDTGLALVNREETVIARLIRSCSQGALQSKQLVFEIEPKLGHAGSAAFPPPGCAVGPQEALKTRELFPDATDARHGFG